jgi:hypothetical protein
MSGFMFGGSALTLDVGMQNGTGAARQHGDVVTVALENIDTAAADGFEAALPEISASAIEQYALCGVVVAPTGIQIPAGENMTVRIMGPADVRCTGTVAAYQCMVWGDNSDNLTPASAPNWTSANVQTVFAVKAIALEATTGAVTDALVRCWVRGLV